MTGPTRPVAILTQGGHGPDAVRARVGHEPGRVRESEEAPVSVPHDWIPADTPGVPSAPHPARPASTSSPGCAAPTRARTSSSC